MNQTDKIDQQQAEPHAMSYETWVQDSGHEDDAREETADLMFINPKGMSVPGSEWQCNAEFLLCEYGIPGMAPSGKMSGWIRSGFPTTEKPPGEDEPDEEGEYYFDTLTAFQFTEMGEAASIRGKVMLTDDTHDDGEDDEQEILATADVVLTLPDTPENRAALMSMLSA